MQERAAAPGHPGISRCLARQPDHAYPRAFPQRHDLAEFPYGHGKPQDFPKRVKVVVRDPAAEAEKVLRNDSLRCGVLEDGADCDVFREFRERPAHGKNYPRRLPFTEADGNHGPRAYNLPQILGDRVVQNLVEGRCQDDDFGIQVRHHSLLPGGGSWPLGVATPRAAT